MYNKDVCRYLNCMNSGTKYIGDLCVEEGYGQLRGGYLSSHKLDDKKAIMLSQKEHFLNYYLDKGEEIPTYNYLRCPQLILFIAEICGISRKRLMAAYEIVKLFEKNNNLKPEDKNGNYMWGKPEFREFKRQLNISLLVKMIKSSENWTELVEGVQGFE